MYTTDLVVLQKIESEWFELEGTIKDHLVHPSLPPPPLITIIIFTVIGLPHV